MTLKEINDTRQLLKAMTRARRIPRYKRSKAQEVLLDAYWDFVRRPQIRETFNLPNHVDNPKYSLVKVWFGGRWQICSWLTALTQFPELPICN